MTASSDMRARDFLPFPGNTGTWNAITDVPGVEVGYETISRAGVLTGVTIVFPRGQSDALSPCYAGFHAFNGNGELTGTHWIEDGGYFVGPIGITNTHSVGRVHSAIEHWLIEKHRKLLEENYIWLMPVVGETWDGYCNDILGLHVTEETALKAISNSKTGPVDEGNVGGGAGMVCYQFKGGTGTSSRVVDFKGEAYTIGVLVQANHGSRPWLRILGQEIPVDVSGPVSTPAGDKGSIIVIIATDAPMMPHQLRRMAKRGSIGIGRGGTVGGNGSGDIFMAFSTANKMPLPQLRGPFDKIVSLNDENFDPFYEAAVQAVEEAVVNAMFAAKPAESVREPKIVQPIRRESVAQYLIKKL